MNDPQLMSRIEIEAAINQLLGPRTDRDLVVVRVDRHNATSKIKVLVLTLGESEGLGFMKLTEIAGLFGTPHIGLSALPTLGNMGGDPTTPEAIATLQLRVTW
jgi:hypothetical protein